MDVVSESAAVTSDSSIIVDEEEVETVVENVVEKLFDEALEDVVKEACTPEPTECINCQILKKRVKSLQKKISWLKGKNREKVRTITPIYRYILNSNGFQNNYYRFVNWIVVQIIVKKVASQR